MSWTSDNSLLKKLSECTLAGYHHAETLCVVRKDFPEYAWSLRTLKRRLKFFDISKNDSNVGAKDFLSSLKKELNGPGKLLGYRAMHQRIRMKYGLRVKRDDVYMGMNILAPQHLEERKALGKRKKFHKRHYTSKGPNWMWCVDGHDKLIGLYTNEFPLAVHGCIDSFSRKIIWLRVWPSNCSPALPARLYYEAVLENRVVPDFVRSDRGNENTKLAQMHSFLRQSKNGHAHIYGSSITNQVIERWWRDFRERNGNFFRDYIQELVRTGMYNDKDDTSRTILAVLMIPILQRELNQFRKDWNSHRIQAQNIYRPCSIPDLMHSCPEKSGTIMFGMEPDEERLRGH